MLNMENENDNGPQGPTVSKKNEHVKGFLRVRLTEDANEYMKKGMIGRIKIHELSRHGDIITAKFYPEAPGGVYAGFGLVTWPKFESVNNPHLVVGEYEDGVCDICGEEKPVKVVSQSDYHKVWACDECMDEDTDE